MKKLCMLLAACALLLTACGGNSAPAASSASSEATSAASSVPASGETPFQQVDAVYYDFEIENSPVLRQKSELAGIEENAEFEYDLTADNMGNIETDVILHHAEK